MADVPPRDLLQDILALLSRQQRVSEHTSHLVESMVGDVGRFREQSERLAILHNRIEAIERIVADFDRRRLDCIENVSEQFQRMDEKRENTKDRIAEIEKRLESRIYEIELTLRESSCDERKDLEKMISDVRVDVATVAAKYGSVVAVVVSLVIALVQWAMGHAHKQ